jgi:hypothetical protein
MKVFISWSGSRSRYVAEALRNWIPKVLQAVKPWMSEEDIATGTRWFSEISQELETTKAGIICLTPENQHNPWIMFEAGSLSKTISQTYVCPYLYDLSPSQLSGPMTQFQAALSNEDGTLRIIQTLNRALGNMQLPPSELDEIFEVWWPKLEERLMGTPEVEGPQAQKRPSEEILEEILNHTREQLRREDLRLLSSKESGEKLDEFIGVMTNTMRALDKFQGLFERAYSNMQTFPPEIGPGSVNEIAPLPNFNAMENVIQGMKELFDKQRVVQERILRRHDEEAEPPNASDDKSK